MLRSLGRRLALALTGALALVATRAFASDPAPSALRVNQHAVGAQQSPAIAVDASGAFVVAWQSELNGSDEIRARRFDARGVARGDEFSVNTLASGPQNLPALAVAPDGRFVVVWQSLVASNFQIRARRFDAAGLALGDELVVSTRRGDTHGAARVAMDARANFVVVWESPIHGSYEIRARRYTAAGLAQGEEIAVNTLRTSSQRSPAVAMNARGAFVVVWRSNVAGSFAIRAQRFDAKGAMRGEEIAVNALRAGDQLAPAVALDGRGNFVVVWEHGLDDHFEIRARRFTALGVAQGEETAISPESAGNQFAPALSMNVSGDHVVTWHMRGQGDASIRARAFASSGAARGTERTVSPAQGSHKSASVALNARGASAFAWQQSQADTWEIAARCAPRLE
jgi:hypothetical protein